MRSIASRAAWLGTLYSYVLRRKAWKPPISVIKGHLFCKEGKKKLFNILAFIQVKAQFREGIEACAGNEVCVKSHWSQVDCKHMLKCLFKLGP